MRNDLGRSVWQAPFRVSFKAGSSGLGFFTGDNDWKFSKNEFADGTAAFSKCGSNKLCCFRDSARKKSPLGAVLKQRT